MSWVWVQRTIQHTSASLALSENASPEVRRDFEAWFDRAVPERAPYWTHTLEGEAEGDHQQARQARRAGVGDHQDAHDRGPEDAGKDRRLHERDRPHRARLARALGRQRLPGRPQRETIPLEARIVSTCDAFNAMTTTHSYRTAMPPAEAIAELERCAGSHFDPRVVRALLRAVATVPAPVEPEEDRVAQRSPAAGLLRSLIGIGPA